MSFKVGDWVISDDELCKVLEDNGSTYKVKVYRSLEKSHPDYLIQDCFKEYIEPWSPKEGDYCWFCEDPENFPIGFILDRFLRMSKYNSFETKHSGEYYDYCFPFTGELPYEA